MHTLSLVLHKVDNRSQPLDYSSRMTLLDWWNYTHPGCLNSVTYSKIIQEVQINQPCQTPPLVYGLITHACKTLPCVWFSKCCLLVWRCVYIFTHAYNVPTRCCAMVVARTCDTIFHIDYRLMSTVVFHQSYRYNSQDNHKCVSIRCRDCWWWYLIQK